MGRIYYIIGKSATGKDSILDELTRDPALGLRKIVQYTTRPRRGGEEEGREYHFISMEESDRLLDAGKVIEMREYNTVYGIWRYMLVDDGLADPGKGRFAAVGTIASYQKVRDYYGSEAVVPIYIFVETGERLERALRRERTHAYPKYTEMCRRFLTDEADFSDEKLQEAGLMAPDGTVRNAVENIDFQECVQEVREIILKDGEES